MASDRSEHHTRVTPRTGNLVASDRLSADRLSAVFVDPDYQLAEALGRALPSAWSWISVASAREALDTARNRTLTLIAIELDLPDLPGTELVSLLRRLPTTYETVLIAITGRSAVREKIAAFHFGVDDYLVKPVTPAAFALHVRLLRCARGLGQPVL